MNGAVPNVPFLTAPFLEGVLTMHQFFSLVCLLLVLSPLVDAKIVFHAKREGDNSYEIYVMDDDGSNLQKLTNDNLSDRYLVWSPDGTQIAFEGRVDSQNTAKLDVFVMNADGSAQRNLTQDAEFNGGPSWAPDGQSPFL